MSKKIIKTKAPNHILIPKHVKITVAERKELFNKYHISFKELPKIKQDDPAIIHMKLENGDIVKVIRQSKTGGEIAFYRGVTNV